MLSTSFLRAAHAAAVAALRDTPPPRPTNPFFGVGPISDGSGDEVDRRQRRLAFERWVEARYRKHDDRGRDLGGYTVTELARSMHRGEPADSILRDMMRAIHRYFEFPDRNLMAVGLGGGHTGFTVCVQHLMSLTDPGQLIYIDTPRPESPAAAASGFFRQSWASQIVDLCRLSHPEGSPGPASERLHFSGADGTIPSAQELRAMGITLFIGVGHETRGASAYSSDEIRGLLDWLQEDPANRHAIIDATSLLGAMPWPPELVAGVLARCCLFMPLQKAIGGVAGYYVASFTPEALEAIGRNLARPSWAIARQLSLSVPKDPAHPLTGGRTLATGPFYDPAQDRMLGGVINTYSLLAFAETTYGLSCLAQSVGPASALNARSRANLALVEDWVGREPLFSLAVGRAEKRGTAVTLLCVNDPDIAPLHGAILARAKQLLGHQGLTHPDGQHEPGLRAALYVNAFPGMAGDFRAWIGGVRPAEDIHALLENLRHAWLRAKALVIAEELAARGEDAPALAAEAAPEDPAALPGLQRLAREVEDLAALLGGLRDGADLARHRDALTAGLQGLAERLATVAPD